MKVLIWIGTIFAVVLANTLLGALIGIQAGYLIVFLAIYVLASYLCKKWENSHGKKPTDQKDPEI